MEWRIREGQAPNPEPEPQTLNRTTLNPEPRGSVAALFSSFVSGEPTLSIDPASLQPACAGLDRGGLVTGVLMDGAGMILVLDLARLLLSASPGAPGAAAEPVSPWITPTLKSF